MTLLLAILLLVLAVGCRVISELANHGKLKWSKGDDSFWGEESWRRKYSKKSPFDSPDNWYYRLFNIGVRERFPLSATFLVFATDGMHAAQFAYHVFLALSLSMFSGESFWFFWPWIPAVHALFYRIFSK